MSWARRGREEREGQPREEEEKGEEKEEEKGDAKEDEEEDGNVNTNVTAKNAWRRKSMVALLLREWNESTRG